MRRGVQPLQLGAAVALAFEDVMGKPYGIHANYDWEWLGDYGSRLRDYALAYALLTKHQVQHAQRENLLQQVAAQLSRNRYYYSTQVRIALFLAARAVGLSPAESWSAQLTSSCHAGLGAMAGGCGCITTQSRPAPAGGDDDWETF